MPSLESFADVKQILDSAIRSGGGMYRLSSSGSAIAWRQRANKFRKQWYAERRTPDYEYLILRLPNGSDTVEIAFRQPSGEFIPTSSPAEFIPNVPAESSTVTDELDEVAADIRRNLNLE